MATGDDRHRDDAEDGARSEGQVSEVTAMTPGGGAEGTPGTDDGVPPAADGRTEADGPPRDYGAEGAE